MQKGSDELGKAMNESIIKPELIEIVQEVGEITLDSFLNDGLLKEIPILGTLIKFRKIGVGIRDIMFAKKLFVFLHSISDTTAEQREKFVTELESNSSKLQKVGETIVFYLDQYDHVEKAEILGKLATARMQQRIDYSTFERLAAIVNRAYMPDLRDLVRIHRNEQVDDDILDNLASVGLMTSGLPLSAISQIVTTSEDEATSLERKINKLGVLLIEIGLT